MELIKTKTVVKLKGLLDYEGQSKINQNELAPADIHTVVEQIVWICEQLKGRYINHAHWDGTTVDTFNLH